MNILVRAVLWTFVSGLCIFFGCGDAKAQEDDTIIEWKPLRVVDVQALEWGDLWTGPDGMSRGKTLYSKNGSFMLYIAFNPGWDAVNKARHYHDFHEWDYVLDGDFLLYEFVSPEQQKGTLVHMREGTWMSRPPFSIHGNRPDAMEHQRVTPGSAHLTFIEGGKNFSLDPANKWYSEEWKQVKQFTNALFQHTADIEAMEWEDDNELPGASVKWLSDDMEDGFRAKIRYLPPGWSHARGPEKTYYEMAQRFIYGLAGDLRLQLVEGADDEGKSITISKDFFVEQPPMSIWTWGEGPLTKNGFMWLEVTYAKGTRVGFGPIETPKTLP